MTVTHKLISGWRNCNLDSKPYLFPDDVPHITSANSKIFNSFSEYFSSEEFGLSNGELHTGLLPLPYAGNLEKASIFVLLLNPGLSPGDYFAEEKTEFRNAKIQNLRQEIGNIEYPHISLNPQFAWHSGFTYWHDKLDKVIAELVKKSGLTYQEAMSILSKNLASLELVPYHSKSFKQWKLLKKLPSVEAMRNFVHEILVPKAKEGKGIIIATRCVNDWQLPEHENIINYNSGEARAAHLSPSSRGGNAILNHMKRLMEKGG